MRYNRPTHSIEVRDVIKNSHFIGNTKIIENREQGLAFVQHVKSLHTNANHSCHCFIAGAPHESSTWSYSDDGEPKGTAGLPMFQVLKHSGIGNVCVVVTRYFGGIKLGTGGIARAYSSLVKQSLAASETIGVEQTQLFTLQVPFELTGYVEQLIARENGVQISDRHWHSTGQLLSLCIEEPSISIVEQGLEAYAHRLKLCILDET